MHPQYTCTLRILRVVNLGFVRESFMADRDVQSNQLCCPCSKAWLNIEIEHASDEIVLHVTCEACGINVALTKEEMAQAVVRAALERLGRD